MTKNSLLKLMLRNVIICFLMVCALICFPGCKSVRPVSSSDPFRALYDLEKKEFSVGVESEEKSFITLSAFNMPLSLFCRVISDRFRVGMVYSDSLSDRVITAEFKSTDLSSVLNVLSRQLSVDVVRVGNTYFIGTLRPEDRGVLVRRCVGYDAVSLKSTADSILSSNGKSFVLANGVLVATDHDSVLRRLVETLDYMDSVHTPTWIVQLYFVALRKDAMLEAGFDLKSSGTLSYDIMKQRINVENLSLDGIFSFDGSSDFVDVYACPMLICRDGKQAVWKDGQTVPVPKKSVSNQGTVTTTGFDNIDVGFNVTSLVSESLRGGLLTLTIRNSSIKSYVEYSPVLSDTSYNMSADMVPDRLYLLGELSTYKQSDGSKGIGFVTGEIGKVSLQVWAKIYKIDLYKDKELPPKIPAVPTGTPGIFGGES